ncbi:MAG TPA: trypsin-like serine protease [Kofleriaceae bacterium]|nr:trypsin-like serine protease [Kofleriaceae bacterium]
MATRVVAGAWLVGLAAAGCTDARTDTSEVQQRIVGGTPTTGDPAVVAVARRRIGCGDMSVVTCSGVLVAPRVVLTAAHCVTGSTRGALEVIFGNDAAAPSTMIVVASAQAYAGYDPSTGDGDIAALLLADDAPVAAIARPTGTIMDVTAGATLRAVGFGVTAWTATDPGVKREGSLALGEVRAGSFDATPSPAMTCTADSGGPVFATINANEELVGLTSRGDAACATTAVNARVDVAQSPFVDPFVTASASAPPGWPAGLPPIDALATTSCTTDAECPALMTCSVFDHHCGFAWLGAGSFGAACANDADCGAAPARCARVWPDGADACRCFTSSMQPPGPDAGTGSGELPPNGCDGCAGSGGDALPLPFAILLAQLGLLELSRRRARNRVDKHERVR